MAVQVGVPSFGVTTYSYSGISYRVFLWLPRLGCPAFELQHIPTDGIPLAYSDGCPGRGPQLLNYNIFLQMVFLESILMAQVGVPSF